MNDSSYVGWDIGGAHLKVACINEAGKLQHVNQYATPLWQGLECLEKTFPEALNNISAKTPKHVVTMTAELVDIFSNRAEGVNRLISISENNLGESTKFYTSNQKLLDISSAREHSELLASANWHASTTYVAKKIDTGLFVDIGSTTTDIIPFQNGKLINQGSDDYSRMRNDELLYTGVVRTPLMALTQKAPFNGVWQSIAAECFSTTADIYRILRVLRDTDDLMDTPDAEAKDISSSIRRMARMLGMDAIDSSSQQKWIQLAEYFSSIQRQMIMNAISRVMSFSFTTKPIIVGAGVGDFLVKQIANNMNLKFVEFYNLLESDQELQHASNVCAPAVSLAYLNRSDHLK